MPIGIDLILWIRELTLNLPSNFSATKEELEEINISFQSGEDPQAVAFRILDAREE